MKKNFVYAMMSAIALSGAVSLTSCSSNEEVTENNPTYDGTSVRTDFTFNITKASPTRQSAEAVQDAASTATPFFRGMSNMHLFPFALSGSEPTSDSESNTGANYALGSLTNTEISNTSPSKKIYSLILPVGTDNFLFYGTASRLSTEDDFAVGHLNTTLTNATKKASEISFSLQGIASSLGDDATYLADYLSIIAQTPDWAGTVDIVKNQTGDNPGAYKALADLYSKFTTTTNDRCGSAEAVLRTLKDLYKSAAGINDQSSVTGVQTIAKAICSKIENGTTNLSMSVTKDDPADPDSWVFSLRGNLSDAAFPSGTLKLPMGAVQLTFNDVSKTFAYKGVVAEPSTTITNVSGVAYNTICYPAEIVYFDNSPLRANDNYKKADDYPSTTGAWDDEFKSPTSGAEWYPSTVSSTTRAVAMQNNVNYGVALLETNVKLEDADLSDNMDEIVGGTAQPQTINGTGMKVTGILIGGQPATVKWDMTAQSSSASDFANVIYDNAVTFKDTYLSTSYFQKPNYTIVLDNYKGTTTGGAQQEEVYIALQLTNGDTDFYGKNGMIPAGHTFYLVGSLNINPTSGNIASAYSAQHGSPYRITDEANGRVFVQDYKTKANITITANALKNAYSSIPDLRSTEVVFGLSVDMNWETGYVFNMEMK